MFKVSRTKLFLRKYDGDIADFQKEQLRKIGEFIERKHGDTVIEGMGAPHKRLEKRKEVIRELKALGLLPWYWWAFKLIFIPFIEYVLFGDEP